MLSYIKLQHSNRWAVVKHKVIESHNLRGKMPAALLLLSSSRPQHYTCG